MAKKLILIIEDEPKTEAKVKEALEGYDLQVVSEAKAALEYLSKSRPDLILLDHDLKGIDGLQFFRQIQSVAPAVKVIMLSAQNDIPLAVTATKLGVSDFLKKPPAAAQLRAAVEDNLQAEEERFLRPASELWLQGQSPKLERMYADLRKVLLTRQNLMLLGERGVEKVKVVEFLHATGFSKQKKLKLIDLLSFRRENLEAHFWATVQEALAEPADIQERCGTLYLENIESLEDNFRASILEFFKERKNEVFTVIGVYEKVASAKDFALIEVPPLRERKEDLAQLLGHYLNLYSVKHNKRVKGFSSELLSLLTLYDYPGNYRELENLIEEGVLASSSEILGLPDIPLGIRELLGSFIKKSLQSGKLSLEEAKRGFEKGLYATLLSKTGGDAAQVARLLDLPRTALSSRLDELGSDFSD